ncbi:hypothetical protein RhiirA5_430348 [Rhizophagus irregularis]|uniref:Uncharacterized protein n=1 Tax=Rhizophagus irregularis TaxID=588596 RepID=A0A2N0NWV9_9GLOM|nr:hypothetical protein RhiirA5_430348 [Rhizophagus irregularis]PKC55878.1 hypothetical protein RhiirA1_474869 [Rhizophagus irregularis]
MGMDAEYFNQAEGITIYTSRSLSYSHMKPNNKLIKESINDKEYITKEYEFDINEI